MKKFIYLFLILSCFCILEARVINAIAVLVNGEPITTYEIKEFAKKNHVSINDATNALIQQKLADEEIKRLGIGVTQNEINQAIENLAKMNNLDVETFKKRVLQEGKTLYELKQDIAKKIKREKLYQLILRGAIKRPTDEDLKRLYQQHKKEFNIPYRVDVIQYISDDKSRLRQKLITPAFPIEGVAQTPVTPIFLNRVPPDLAKLLLSTKTGAYTPILNLSGKFVAFKVLKKYKKNIPFDKIKEKLQMAYLAERRQAKLIEYFEKKKAEANVKILRKPE